MKENWGLLVPYLAMVTGCQLFATSLAKVLSALPYKKLDRLAKTVEAAVGLASATMLVGLFVVVARAPDGVLDVPAGERLWMAREYVLGYAVFVAFYLGWAIAIVFGGLRSRFWAVALSIGLPFVAWTTTLDGRETERLAKALPPVFFTCVALAGLTFVVFRLAPGFVHRHVVSRWHRFVHWLEPTDLPADARTVEQSA